MEQTQNLILEGSKECMRDRTHCPALLFCRVRAASSQTLYAKFFKCAQCDRTLFEGWVSGEPGKREYFDNGEGDFSGPILEDCPLMTTSVIDICPECRVEESDKFVTELGGPSDRDEDDFNEQEI